MRILIIKLGALGDVLRTTFIARGFKEKYPNVTITWLTKENAKAMLENNQFIDTIVTWDNHQHLADEKWDWLIQLDDEEEVCTFAAMCETERFQGAYMDDHGKRCYTPDVEPWFGIGLLRPESRGGKAEADRLKALNRKTFQEIYAEMFDIKECSNKQPILNLTNEEQEQTKHFKEQHSIPQNHTIIGLNTGAGKRWPLKRISEEKTAQLAQQLAAKENTTVLILGGLDEEERNNNIKSLCPQANIINIKPVPNIRTFATIINACDCVVVADTLALHIAIALNKKTVVFFCPTSPWEIEMFGLGERLFKESDYLCTYKKDFPNDCDPTVSVDELLHATQKTLEKQ